MAMARAMPTRRSSPKGNVLTRRSALSARPTAARISSASARAALREMPWAMAPASTFSSAVRPAKGSTFWKVRTRPRRLRSCGFQSFMSAPARRTSPWSTSWKPVSTLTRVVLPAPFGPISPSTSPRARVRLTRSMARSPWKFTTTSETVSSDVVASLERDACSMRIARAKGMSRITAASSPRAPPARRFRACRPSPPAAAGRAAC